AGLTRTGGRLVRQGLGGEGELPDLVAHVLPVLLELVGGVLLGRLALALPGARLRPTGLFLRLLHRRRDELGGALAPLLRRGLLEGRHLLLDGRFDALVVLARPVVRLLVLVRVLVGGRRGPVPGGL